MSATREPHHPLQALEAKIADLQRLLAIRDREIGTAQQQRTSARKSLERVRNENMRLSAAISEVSGTVSKIGSESMWKKEAGVLATKLERWHQEDRAELCYRALYRSWDDNHEHRLAHGLADLCGGIFDKMSRQIQHERDVEVAEHLRTKGFIAAVVHRTAG